MPSLPLGSAKPSGFRFLSADTTDGGISVVLLCFWRMRRRALLMRSFRPAPAADAAWAVARGGPWPTAGFALLRCTGAGWARRRSGYRQWAAGGAVFKHAADHRHRARRRDRRGPVPRRRHNLKPTDQSGTSIHPATFKIMLKVLSAQCSDQRTDRSSRDC